MNMINFCYTPLRGILGVLTAAAWFAVCIYAKQFMKNDARVRIYNVSSIVTLGAAMGVFFASDFFTLFFFFEIMSLASFIWVAHRNTKEARYAAGMYLGISIAGGMSMLMGLFIVYSQLGTLDFETLGRLAYEGKKTYSENMVFAAAVCMFVGFGAKAGAFPLHVWLPASYTQAPAPAAALLSAVLSKTGVFGLLLVTGSLLPMNEGWGKLMLLTGAATMLAGGIRGVMSDNFKTTLAYSSMSQIGFMLMGIGMQPFSARLAFGGGSCAKEALEAYNMALNGTLLHMINHSLVKLVLFMLAGAVFMNAGSYDLNKLRGFGRKKPFLLAAFLLAALGVGGVPLLNGYVSKTLLHEGIAEYAQILRETASPDFAFFRTIEYIFIFSGGLTLAYMAKLFIVLFVDKNEDSLLQGGYEKKKAYMHFSDMAAVLICAAPIPVIGIFPRITAEKAAEYAFMGNAAAINYFSVKNLSGALISAVLGAAVYIAAVRLLMLGRKDRAYRELFPKWLDMERYVYRAVFYRFIPFVLGIISRILDSIADMSVVILRKTLLRDRPLPYELPEGNPVTHLIGKNMELASKAYCAAAKKEYKEGGYEHKLALKSMDIFENMRIIEGSLSFGFFMFCVGLLLTMLYLLAVN